MESGTSEKILETLNEIKKQLSKFEEFVPEIQNYLQNLYKNFTAGRVSQHFPAWTEKANDKEILSHITGVIIECAE